MDVLFAGPNVPTGPGDLSMTALPPLEYLVDCSESALQTLELKSLDLAAQCSKRARAEMEQALVHRSTAEVCRFLIENRSELIDLAKLVADGKQRLLFAERKTA
jgi:hypothetical protein